MAYHMNVYLLLFLPLALLTYQIVPRRMRWKVLLIFSYLFFYLNSRKLIVFLIGTTLLTHYVGIWLAWLKGQRSLELAEADKEQRPEIKRKSQREQRFVLAVGIVLLLSVLGYIKYYNFFVQNFNHFFAGGGFAGLQMKDLLMPLGISFYSLQAIGYMADVYWERIPAERHLGKMALFLSFFPQIMEGPICQFSDTAESLWKCESLKMENLTGGCMRILWGLFKKMIIADRLNMLVKIVFNHYQNYSGIVVAGAAVAYTVQLYMEFSGAMDIILGSGRLFGVNLPENFRQPFASQNAAEFWRRWHITLGAWLKRYVFYPVSVSRMVKNWNHFGKKHLNKYATRIGMSALALFPVWLCNGLWHGARWSYIFYGMYYFVILLAGIALEAPAAWIREKCHINEKAVYWKVLRIAKTWVIIFTGELFFRANGLLAGFSMFASIFHNFRLQALWDGTFLTLGLGRADYAAIFSACIVVGIVGFLRERNIAIIPKIQRMRLPVRWAVFYCLILAVIIFGAYGAGYQPADLIYAGF